MFQATGLGHHSPAFSCWASGFFPDSYSGTHSPALVELQYFAAATRTTHHYVKPPSNACPFSLRARLVGSVHRRCKPFTVVCHLSFDLVCSFFGWRQLTLSLLSPPQNPPRQTDVLSPHSNFKSTRTGALVLEPRLSFGCYFFGANFVTQLFRCHFCFPDAGHRYIIAPNSEREHATSSTSKSCFKPTGLFTVQDSVPPPASACSGIPLLKPHSCVH